LLIVGVGHGFKAGFIVWVQHGFDIAPKVGTCIDFAAVVPARSIAEVPARFDLPIRPKALFAQGFVMEAGADRFFGDDDDQ
jgi:hypothetical protein